MKIRGNTVGTTMPRSDFEQNDPNKADYIKNKPAPFIVSNTAPAGPAIWFNTAPGGAVNNAALLSLDDDEGGYSVQAIVGDEVYGVGNATANQGATGTNYDFTVL